MAGGWTQVEVFRETLFFVLKQNLLVPSILYYLSLFCIIFDYFGFVIKGFKVPN